MRTELELQARVISVRDPRTGARDEQVTLASAQELADLAARLRAAQPEWAGVTIEARAAALLRLSNAIKARLDDIATALERDTGRRRIARLEVLGVVSAIEGWARGTPGLLPSGWAVGRSNPSIRHAPQFVPYALVGVISPWNFPLTLTMIDAVPALLAGCAVLAKPSDVTPRFIAPLSEAIAEAGLAGVFTLVPGDGPVGAAVIDAVDLVCFTGSVATGRIVAAQAAARLVPAFLELGGKDPLIVLPSADIDQAATAAFRGSVLSTGQACQSIERIYVHRSLYDGVLERLTEAAGAARLNWPDIARGEIGPIIFERQAAILSAQIEDAVAKGARLLAGGTIEHHGGGLWLRPTVLADVTHEMLVMREETFGPVLPVRAFDTVDEAVDLANDGAYGLSAAVFAGSLDEAEAVARRIEAGAISLNDCALTATFHEAAKQSFRSSGLGPSRMGMDGYTRFFRRKALIAQTGRPLPLSSFAEEAG